MSSAAQDDIDELVFTMSAKFEISKENIHLVVSGFV